MSYAPFGEFGNSDMPVHKASENRKYYIEEKGRWNVIKENEDEKNK